MNNEICLMCQKEVAIWMYIIDDKEQYWVCQKCYEDIMEDNRKDGTKAPGKFILLEEYYAEKEIENGSLGIRLTQ